MFLGIVAGPLYDAGHFYMHIVAGTFLVVFGESRSYLGLQLFSGAAMVLTGVLLLATRISKEGPKMRVKI